MTPITRDQWRDIDLNIAAQLYVESPESQHGDLELARWDAELWLGILAEAATFGNEGLDS